MPSSSIVMWDPTAKLRAGILGAPDKRAQTIDQGRSSTKPSQCIWTRCGTLPELTAVEFSVDIFLHRCEFPKVIHRPVDKALSAKACGDADVTTSVSFRELYPQLCPQAVN